MINLNAAFEDELYFKFLKNPDSVSQEWRDHFAKLHGSAVIPSNNFNYDFEKIESLDIHSLVEEKEVPRQSISNPIEKTKPEKKEVSEPKIPEYNLRKNEEAIPLGNIQVRIAKNMEMSLEVPTATSIRTMPVKALDENRRVINKYLLKLKKPKVSFTHILAWAIVKAMIKYPEMNDGYGIVNGKHSRIKRKAVNIGLAIDLTKDDGTRLLMVPSIKNAQDLTFAEFIKEYDNLIYKARNNKLDLNDLEGTSVSLTNPGMIGTSFSNPRLMSGQGSIVAAGAIDYPVEFQAVRPEVLTTLAVSKVVTLTNTYDHRIIQGAQSAEYLAYINKLLLGKDQFYDQIFYSLKIPFEPVRWEIDKSTNLHAGLFEKDDIIEKGAHVMQMINAYRVRGHLLASINPLGFDSYYYSELDPAFYGFTIWDLDRVFHADDSWKKNNLPLRDIIELLRETYCGSTGIEFMHIQDPMKKDWIKQKLETTRNTLSYSNEEKKHILKKLVEAVEFENFLHTKYVGHKRFSLEGGEALIVLLDKIFERAADNQCGISVLGMSHRGRLNVLANIVGKSHGSLFKEFDDDLDPKLFHGSGDVKYHLGDKGNYVSQSGNSVQVVLSPNPSHLELVDPVIVGMARAFDNEIGDETYKKVVPVIVHGDAAFAGQGIVAETLNLSQLDGYRTGGTIHVVVNNQIGFTTTADSARSTVYATDIAKMIQTPIIHVNGNDPEAVRTAANFAIEYRGKFGSDVILDMICYRKYGHNEGDEPSYTQPLLYKKIKSMTNVAKLYAEQLKSERVLNDAEVEAIIKDVKDHLIKEFDNRRSDMSSSPKSLIRKSVHVFDSVYTAITEEIISEITEATTKVPSNFSVNPKIKSLLDKRKEMVQNEDPSIDWAMAESLAFGSLLIQGSDIRFAGQDSRRGTFSQRHAVLYDTVNEYPFTPLNHIRENQAKLRIFDSPLSEVACLGFEFGYSTIASNALTFWEAQFGDFVNNAQTITDQYISCAEYKWGVTSNLVMLLPHGYDGQGPEHSSARIERFLQMCSEDNMIIGNFTTPAQYFHAIRRHMLMPYKMPMVLFTPKSMLRHPKAVSSKDDLTKGKFHTLIDDYSVKNFNIVERLIFCSGKIYWDLLAEKEANNYENVAIIRIEQIYPLDTALLASIIGQYSKANEIYWVQEEPKNMGIWSFIKDYFDDILVENQKLSYIGRKASPSTATGSFKVHINEQNEIIKKSFDNLSD